MLILRILALTISLVLAGTIAIRAETPPAPPPGLTQEQFDSLVDAIGKSVVEKLKAEGVSAPAPEAVAKPKSGKGTPSPRPDIVRTTPRQGPSEFALFVQRLGKVAMAFPDANRPPAACINASGLGASACHAFPSH